VAPTPNPQNPNPQSPIPNPQLIKFFINLLLNKLNKIII